MKVMIVGGGVAALEALLALRGLAEDRVSIEVVAPEAEFVYRPLAVAEPFGLGEAGRYGLVRIAEDQGAALHLAGLAAMQPENHVIDTWDGRVLPYDVLLLAIGARPGAAVPGAVTIAGPGYTGRFRTVLRELGERRITRVVFAVPPVSSWPLPVYELALMTAAHVAERGLRKVELALVTPEAEPLELFGSAASAALRELLDQRGVALHTAHYATEFSDQQLVLAPSGALAADRVVSLPRLRGPQIRGLPSTPKGSFRSTSTGSSRARPTSMPQATRRRRPSNRVVSRRSRRTPPRRRSRPARAPTSSLSRSGRFCGGCS